MTVFDIKQIGLLGDLNSRGQHELIIIDALNQLAL